jgi:hypothetical protein
LLAVFGSGLAISALAPFQTVFLLISIPALIVSLFIISILDLRTNYIKNVRNYPKTVKELYDYNLKFSSEVISKQPEQKFLSIDLAMATLYCFFKMQEITECVALQAQYIYDTYGKFPATVQSIFSFMYIQAHHLDLVFYDHYFKSGAYLTSHKEYMIRWH